MFSSLVSLAPFPEFKIKDTYNNLRHIFSDHLKFSQNGFIALFTYFILIYGRHKGKAEVKLPLCLTRNYTMKVNPMLN
jgi:hypothetical protein